ncbi:MAG: phosphoribosylamine--glycine ligase [Candidatus Hydrogenedentota bacterium]
MRVAVLGKGGREHCIVCELIESKTRPEIYVYPGSDAMLKIAKRIEIPQASTGCDELVKTMKKIRIDLCIVGSEQYLEDGIADRCIENRIAVFGPVKSSARLETSKVFGKEFMRRNNIPTADFNIAYNDKELMNLIKVYPVVLKYDGLAAGKGVSICYDEKEVKNYINDVFTLKKFGQIKPVIVEECLQGKELSVICAVSDGAYRIFPCARDYKRLFDGDKGPNTGGMGAVASTSLITANLFLEIKSKIIEPTIKALLKNELSYRGFLYFGLILTDAGPKVLEYNCRFGDPEAQAILPLIDGDFTRFIYKAAKGVIDDSLISSRKGWCTCLVLASQRYPYESDKGAEIKGLEAIRMARVYHSGTYFENGCYKVSGGRALSVSAIGYNRESAVSRVYSEIEKIYFEGMQYRRDIGRLHFE